ncbi:MAG TPA: serine/threonine-protein kinase [Thermoanaerobaculia bacterium]|nr:serine/threonine-protein kinase [Thermoanaerobaculia bacterium]
MTAALPPGSRIGRFEVSGVLGEGAMGVVYLAHDPQIERPVAIKTLRASASGASSGELETRFLKEAKLAGRLQHPNIVTIYEAGQDGSVPYIAMEFVDGEPLTRFLGSRDALSIGERVEVVRQTALALQHAHERGVLHRDVKPGNILLTRDHRVKVADFGIGKLLSATAELTRTGQMIGSPAYMSPEQIRGAKLDGRSDYFSLGVVFYELLTGVRPFPGDSITTLVYQILHTEPRDPLEVRKDLPPAAREVFARLLAKAPEQRPKDGEEFLAELRRIADQLGQAETTVALTAPYLAAGAAVPPVPPPPPVTVPAAASAGGPAPAPPAPNRRPLAMFLFGLAALLIAGGFFLSKWRTRRGEPEPASQAAAAPTSAALGAHLAPETAATAPPAVTAPPSAAEAVLAPPTIGPLPTAGPRSAADSVVGAPRAGGGTGVTRAPRPTYAVTRIAAADIPPPPAEEVPAARGSRESGGGSPVDNVYRTRRYAKFGVSPDQARMYVDGRYVGIADDWDDRGGGRKYEFAREGVHRVHFELPGHRDLNVEIVVSPNASDDTADVGDELKRDSRVPYTKLSSPEDRTVGPVVFEVNPPDATITEGSRTLGPASAFGPSSPLRLSGPMVHDLVLSAPGRKPKTVRILVGPSADRDVAKVKVELKKES